MLVARCATPGGGNAACPEPARRRRVGERVEWALLAAVLAAGCATVRPVAPALASSPFQQPLWLAIGQSNMEEFGAVAPPGAGRVEVQQFNADPQFDILTWTPLTASTPFSAVAGQFAAALSTLANRSVRILSAAEGGTRVTCWEPGGTCYARLAPLRAAKARIEGIIWWQGDSEGVSADADVIEPYRDKLRRLLQTLRSDFRAPTLPILIVGLQHYCHDEEAAPSTTCEEPPGWASIRAAQHAVAAGLRRVVIVDVNGVTRGFLHPIDEYPVIGTLLAEEAAKLR